MGRQDTQDFTTPLSALLGGIVFAIIAGGLIVAAFAIGG